MPPLNAAPTNALGKLSMETNGDETESTIENFSERTILEEKSSAVQINHTSLHHGTLINRAQSVMELPLLGADAKTGETDGFRDREVTTLPAEIGKLCFGCSGILAAYLLYGHVQEDLFRSQPDGTKFKFVWFLQVLECTLNVMVAATARWYLCRGSGASKPRGLNLCHFLTSGTSQTFSKALTSLSLYAGLSFPVCTLAKSAKMVPVMVGQSFMGGSVYGWSDYVQVMSIVLGTAILSISEAGRGSKQERDNTVLGVILILLSLVMDGITAGLQKRLKHEARKSGRMPTTYDFMFYTNLSMALTALSIATFFVPNEMKSGFEYMADHGSVQRMIMLVCCCSAVGQSFIFYVVANFDPLVCATVTTTRKVLSVVWSMLHNGSVANLTYWGILGLLMAMSGLMDQVRTKVRGIKCF